MNPERPLRRVSPLALGGASALLGGALLAGLLVGAVGLSPGRVLSEVADRLPWVSIDSGLSEQQAAIVWELRLPRVVLASLVGATLAAAGAAYQGVFRNPLADPYLLGVAAGAGLGATLGIVTVGSASPVVPAAAFAGAVAAVALAYALGGVAGGGRAGTTLILAGVAVSSFATSLTSFLMLRSSNELRRAIGWLLGGSIMNGWEPVLAVLPYILLGLVSLSISGHALNVLQFGEEQAQQLGLPTERVKALLILAASLTTGAAVAFTGIIGFIGLIVPHLARILWGGDYKSLIPLSIIGGATVLLLADLVARVVLAPQVIPVGIVTALVGAPFFLWVLRRAKNQAYW